MGKLSRAIGITALIGALAGSYFAYDWYSSTKPPRIKRIRHEQKKDETQLDATTQFFVRNLHGFDIGPMPMKKSDYTRSQASRLPGLDIDDSYNSVQPDDPYVRKIAAALEVILKEDKAALANQEGANRTDIEARDGELRAQLILDFVHRLPYAKDIDDYAKPPITTLYEGGGDCEDLSVLAVSLARAMKLDSLPIEVPGHMMPSFAIETKGGTVIDIKGQRYVLAEATGTDNPDEPIEFGVGDVSNKYRSGAHATAVMPDGERIDVRTKYVDSKTQSRTLESAILFENHDKPVALIRTSPADRVTELDVMLIGSEAPLAKDTSGSIDEVQLCDLPSRITDDEYERLTVRVAYNDGTDRIASIALARALPGKSITQHERPRLPTPALAYEPSRRSLIIDIEPDRNRSVSVTLLSGGHPVKEWGKTTEKKTFEYPLSARNENMQVYTVLVESEEGESTSSIRLPVVKYENRILVPRDALIHRPTLYERTLTTLKENAKPIGGAAAGIAGLITAAYLSRRLLRALNERSERKRRAELHAAPRPNTPPANLYGSSDSTSTQRTPPEGLWSDDNA